MKSLPLQGTSDWSMAYAQHMALLGMEQVCRHSAIRAHDLSTYFVHYDLLYSTFLHLPGHSSPIVLHRVTAHYSPF